MVLVGFVALVVLTGFGVVFCDLTIPVTDSDERLVVFLGGLTTNAGFFASRVTKPSIDLLVFIIYNYNMKNAKLTKKQLAVLNFIRDFMDENGHSPSYREIMAGLELTSVSAVAEHVDNLVERGALKKVPGAARSLEVLDYRHTETVDLFRAAMLGCSSGEREVLEQAAEILGLEL